MSQTTTLILIPETSYVNPGNGAPYTVVGNSYPAASYYLGNKDLQTVNMKLSQVTGNIVIEASLATSPTNNDWFRVYEYNANAANISTFTNVSGTFVYMRAKIEDFNAGTVEYVKMSY